LGEGTGTDPVNYSRDNHKIVLDDHDRSKNAPHALTGYELALQPEASWPGLGAAEEIKFNPTDMQAVVTTLGSLRKDVASVPTVLAKPTQALSFGAGSWHEANDLARAAQIVSETVREYSNKLIQNLDAAMEHIGGAASRLDVAENAAHDVVRAPGTHLTGGA